MPMFGGIPTTIEVTASVLPTGAATATKQDIIIGHVDGIEPLLAGGLPAALDAGSLKTKEQSPITGYATSAKQDTIIGVMVNRATTPTIYNVSMTLANTEYSQALPANTKKFLIKCRAQYVVKVCFVSGQSGSLYLTIPVGGVYWEDEVQPASLTLYFQCATAAQVAEIIAWA